MCLEVPPPMESVESRLRRYERCRPEAWARMPRPGCPGCARTPPCASLRSARSALRSMPPKGGIAPRCALAALRCTVRWTVQLRSAHAAVPRRDGSLWVAVRRLPGSRALSAARSFDGSDDLAVTARAGRRSRSTVILLVDARCANVLTNRPSAGLRARSILAGLRPAPAARTSACRSARGFRSGKGRASAPLRDVAPGP